MEDIKHTETDKQKKKHPVERSNIITRSFFCWLLPFFVKGFKRDLNEDDMYGGLKSHDAKMLGDKLEAAWNYEVTHRKDPSLWRALLKVFKYEILLYAAYFLINELIKLSRPLIITKFLAYYEPNQTEMSKNEACMYAALFVLVTLVMVMWAHNYLLGNFHLAMKIRVAACSLIYRKALKLSKSAFAETTVGQMVNLLSNDVGRFDFATKGVHYLWLTPIETVVVMYLVYLYVGPTGLAGALFLILFIPLQMYMGKKTSQYRLQTALRTDERVRLMSEIITGIQVIKMYTWEKPFAKLVELSRRREIQQIQATSVIRAIVISFNLVLNRAAIFICILTYVVSGNTLNATYAYTITSFYGVLRNVVTKAFPKAVTQIAETNVSVNRIRKFLLYDEMELNNEVNNINLPDMNGKQSTNYHNGTNGIALVGYKNKSPSIQLKNVSVKWIHSLPENILENININVESNKLVAIVGQVGSGKTTVLHTILKELHPVEGSVVVNGSLSYASQEPWLFGASIRQNIIFGQEFNAKKYEEVVRVCALERDFSLFPYGDNTFVGERGVILSGGQRARINLARAVYKDADIYLLDDPLSAVDSHVGKQLFEECICGYLQHKSVVLVTHQLQYLGNVEVIYLLKDGKVEASGTYRDLQEAYREFAKLVEHGEEQDEEKNEKEEIVEKKDTVQSNQDAPLQKKEFRNTGVVSSQVYRNYLHAGGSWFKLTILVSGLVLSQFLASATDYFVKIWVNLEQWRSANANISNETLVNHTNANITKDSNFNDSVQSFFDVILSQENSIIIYSLLVLATIVFTISRSIGFFRYCMAASIRLHNLMFEKIVYATMRFFNTNPSGRILNRFSKDVGAVDETLPFTFLDTAETALNVLSISLVIGSLNPWIFLPTIVILIIFYYLRLVFLATSRDIKRVEAVTRSPIYTHLSASLQGLTTIRAFGAQDVLRKEFDNFQNQHSAPCYMFLAANRTFGFWLDFHCVVYIALVTISILFIESEIFGGNVGLALTQSMALTGMFQWGMRQWSELENLMTSVERIQEYTEISPEKDEKTKDPPRFWPEEGKIKFDSLCLRYSVDDPYVLNNVTFEINAKEKIGIVGRTGAGKSSLITALFRLTHFDGKIILDGISTKEIPLSILRSKISIIPQEPVLFSGSLRNNLDPFEEYNDNILWSALEEVELKQAVTGLPSGLDSRVSEGGSNFSVGQRQLLCLARAIIRNNKILVLDEATANVDPQTDKLIQITIRQKFADCTVLTIAHRLHTIMDSDKVLVMDAGKVVEFDHPHRLLQNPNGVFHTLVMTTGKTTADNLIAIAEEHYIV